MINQELIEKANEVYNPVELTRKATAGSVAAALVTEDGNVYTGVCFHAACGVGTCAEHAALTAMLTSGETKVEKIVAVNKRGVIPPCGKCREVLYQMNYDNAETEILIDEGNAKKLKDLLPHYWQ